MICIFIYVILTYVFFFQWYKTYLCFHVVHERWKTASCVHRLFQYNLFVCKYTKTQIKKESAWNKCIFTVFPVYRIVYVYLLACNKNSVAQSVAFMSIVILKQSC